MKKVLLIIGAVTVLLAGFASQGLASTHVSIGFFTPVPAYAFPAPITVYETAYERVRPVMIEEPVYYGVPAEYRVVHERWHRDCDRSDRHRYWGMSIGAGTGLRDIGEKRIGTGKDTRIST